MQHLSFRRYCSDTAVGNITKLAGNLFAGPSVKKIWKSATVMPETKVECFTHLYITWLYEVRVWSLALKDTFFIDSSIHCLSKTPPFSFWIGPSKANRLQCRARLCLWQICPSIRPTHAGIVWERLNEFHIKSTCCYNIRPISDRCGSYQRCTD